MANENSGPSAVTNQPREAAPGIPAVEVDPTNELLDGENLDEKRALLQDPIANVQVDPSGRRLEDKQAAQVREAGGDPALVIPPPAAANLELRKRTQKFVDGMYGSIGAGPEQEDSVVIGLRTEREGLQRRADDGDERAQKRVVQIDDQLKARGVSAEEKADAGQKRSAAAEQEPDPQTARAQTPTGRQSKPTTKA